MRHSTETTLLKVKTDILNAVDNTDAICLGLLDFSTAVDTVNHSLLLNRLKFHFGFTDIVLKWVSQYLTRRSQRVIIDGVEGQPQGQSDYVTLNQGVLQGLVLGPILFTLYMSPLGDICHHHGVNFHGYVNDSQIYLAFKPWNTDQSNKDIVLILYNHVWQISEYGCTLIP